MFKLKGEPMRFFKRFRKTLKPDPNIDYFGIAEELLGSPGVIMSSAKFGQVGAHIYSNACVFNKAKEQIWYGDLSITNSERELRELAEAVGMIYVTPEHPARFEGLDKALEEDSSRMPGYHSKVLTYGKSS